jgi:hypothetical protein
MMIYSGQERRDREDEGEIEMSKVIKITRTHGSTAVLVQAKVRKVEYIFDKTDATDAQLTQEFEASPKEAAIKYDAQIDLV